MPTPSGILAECKERPGRPATRAVTPLGDRAWEPWSPWMAGTPDPITRPGSTHCGGYRLVLDRPSQAGVVTLEPITGAKVELGERKLPAQAIRQAPETSEDLGPQLGPRKSLLERAPTPHPRASGISVPPRRTPFS